MKLIFPFLAETEGVSRELDLWSHEDVDLAYRAGALICTYTTQELVEGTLLASKYTARIEDITVVAAVRVDGNRIYVTLTAVFFDGDHDPDGGEGIDHLAFGGIREVARACATQIGPDLSFCQLGRLATSLRPSNAQNT